MSNQLQIGDKVYRLNANGQPMTASNGSYKLRGVVESVNEHTVRVRWIARGMADHSMTYDPPANLQRIEG